ncbi:MAG: treZ [Ilumatobacteraceae bacterium]|nr:treZ [Ilumatobacteraceae bacterium]
MSIVRVWAPHLEAITIETDAPDDAGGGPSVAAMRAIDGGWWEAPEALAADSHYRFVLGDDHFPDPRSPRQPDGPQGWSQLVDHSTFAWTDHDWTGFPLAAAVLYELHVGTFSPEGTFDGVIGRLDDLADLGVTAIEIMPVATFPGARGWGYDGVNLFAPQETYGGPDGLRRLVDACHARHIAVVLDVVYNHLGPVGNSLHAFGPYFTDQYHSPWGDAVNLDGPGSDEVRRFIIDNALQWVVDYHVDGLRLDAVHALHDESAVHILDELGDAVHAAGRRAARTVWVIAESDLNDPRLVRSNEAYGYGLDAAWSDDFHHALHVALTGEQEGYYADFSGVDDLAEALTDVYVFGGKFAPSRERTHGTGVGDMDRSRFVCFAQNHDQIGNRATGERLAHMVTTARAEIAAALLLTSPFVPMLFQGEEWAASAPFQYFTDVDDEEVGNAVREGRRAEFAAFGWKPEDVPDPQDSATWERSRLDWSERQDGDHARVLDWYRHLIALRAEHTDLRDGRAFATVVQHGAGDEWLVIERCAVSVVVNLGDERAIPIRPGATVLLTNGDAPTITASNDDAAITLRRDRVAILVHTL